MLSRRSCLRLHQKRKVINQTEGTSVLSYFFHRHITHYTLHIHTDTNTAEIVFIIERENSLQEILTLTLHSPYILLKSDTLPIHLQSSGCIGLFFTSRTSLEGLQEVINY